MCWRCSAWYLNGTAERFHGGEWASQCVSPSVRPQPRPGSMQHSPARPKVEATDCQHAFNAKAARWRHLHRFVTWGLSIACRDAGDRKYRDRGDVDACPGDDLDIRHANLLLELQKEPPARQSMGGSLPPRYTSDAGRLQKPPRATQIDFVCPAFSAARAISRRTKAALAAAKARGVKLDGDRGYRPVAAPDGRLGGEAVRQAADHAAHRAMVAIEAIRADHGSDVSLHAVARSYTCVAAALRRFAPADQGFPRLADVVCTPCKDKF